MFENLNDIVVSKIALAMYVAPGTGTNVHNDRPFHGLVFNDDNSYKDYYFSDGTVMNTCPGELFYLPKGSSYVVKAMSSGGCYAINFDANTASEPFSMSIRSKDAILKCFKDASKKWRQDPETSQTFVRRCVYDILLEMEKEISKRYIPDAQLKIISPALKKISSDFTEKDLSVSELASLCNVSEVYLRKIFVNKFGSSPKEYIISKRLSYAAQLLASEQFSVNEIARMCGYEELCHFSREFKKRFGVSPREYNKGNIK